MFKCSETNKRKDCQTLNLSFSFDLLRKISKMMDFLAPLFQQHLLVVRIIVESL